MDKVEIWTIDDTLATLEREVSPTDVSINKWYNQRVVLKHLLHAAKGQCGLCIDRNINCLDCESCILFKATGKNCHEVDSQFKKTIESIKRAYDNASEMIKLLGKLQLINKVYFDRDVNMFFQVRRISGRDLVCSDPCRYHQDATTTVCTRTISLEYLSECVEVKELTDRPDLYQHNNIGWIGNEKAKERKKWLKDIVTQYTSL